MYSQILLQGTELRKQDFKLKWLENSVFYSDIYLIYSIQDMIDSSPHLHCLFSATIKGQRQDEGKYCSIPTSIFTYWRHVYI